MTRMLLAAVTALALTACDAPDSPAFKARQEAYCTPEKVAVAPDGTTLWRISMYCDRIVGTSYPVYFSSRGTQTGEAHGKMHYEQVVPNGQ